MKVKLSSKEKTGPITNPRCSQNSTIGDGWLMNYAKPRFERVVPFRPMLLASQTKKKILNGIRGYNFR